MGGFLQSQVAGNLQHLQGRRICLDMVQLPLVEVVDTVPYLIMNTCQHMRPVHCCFHT